MSSPIHVFSGFTKLVDPGPFVCMTACGQHFSLDQRHSHMVDRLGARFSTCEECDAAIVLKMLAEVP